MEKQCWRFLWLNRRKPSSSYTMRLDSEYAAAEIAGCRFAPRVWDATDGRAKATGGRYIASLETGNDRQAIGMVFVE